MKLSSKSLALSAVALIGAVAVLRGQNAPPAPIPSGAQNPGANQPPSGGGSDEPARRAAELLRAVVEVVHAVPSVSLPSPTR